MGCDSIELLISFSDASKGAGLFIIKGNEYGGRVLPNLSPS